MSIKKLSAPKLLPNWSKVPADRARASSISVSNSCSTLSRMRKTAWDAWSNPSTDRTPRIWANWPGTRVKTDLSFGSRKKKSSDFSSSPSDKRSSPTTLPMVCLSLTRRYSSSIHGCKGWAMPPFLTLFSRSAKCWVRAASCASCGSRSSNAASRHKTEVATSIANSIAGGFAERTVASTAWVNAKARLWLLGCSLTSESLTKLN